jgi:hypothetical protein
MRTTVDLPDELFRQAKAQAALEGTPLRDLIETGVRLALAQRKPGRKLQRVRFPLHRSKKPGSLRAADFRAAEAAVAIAEDVAHAGSL